MHPDFISGRGKFQDAHPTIATVVQELVVGQHGVDGVTLEGVCA